MMRIQFDRCLRDPLARPFGATCAQGTGSVRISREDRQVNKLSACNNLSPPDTYGRVIGGEGESLSPAAKKRLRSSLEDAFPDMRAARRPALRGTTVDVAKR